MSSSSTHSSQMRHSEILSKGEAGYSDALILIYPVSSSSSDIQDEVKQVSEITGLDAYTVRQKLTGVSADLLYSGSDVRTLCEQSHALTQAGFQSAFILKSDLSPSANYRRAVSATINSGESTQNKSITFYDINGSEILRWAADTEMLIVTGSLSPEQYGTSKALLASLYNNSAVDIDNDVSNIANSTEALIKDISKQKPALVLIPESGSEPIFLDASKFNYECLGDARSLSLAQNYLALMKALQSLSGTLPTKVVADFGQKTLPIGNLASKPKDELDTQSRLIHYSQLMGLANSQGFFDKTTLESNAVAAESKIIPDFTSPETLAGASILGGAALIPQVSEQLASVIPTAGNSSKQSEKKSAKSQSSQTNRLEQSHLPAPPIGAGNLGGEFEFRTLIRHTQRFGPPWLILTSVSATCAIALFSFFQKSSIDFYWSFIACGIAFCVASFTFAKRKGIIARLATSRIRSMPMGIVEIKGKAKRKYALKAPHSLVNCIYYNYKILERTRASMASGSETDTWRVISRGDSGQVPFYVEDDTGQVLVNPTGAVISGSQTNEYSSSFADMLTGAGAQPDRRIIETVIAEGADLYVVGFANPTSKDPAEKRNEYRKRLTELKSDPDLLARYDTDGDGTISFEEWAKAKADLDNQLLHERLHSGSNTGNNKDNVVIERHSSSGIFYISDKAESDILRSYSWKVPVLGIIGFALLVKGLWRLFGE